MLVAPTRVETIHPRPLRNKAWNAGGLLVAANDAELPQRCLWCNAATNSAPCRRRFAWHPAHLYGHLAGGLSYLVFALPKRKRATIWFHECEEHRWRRRTRLAICIGMIPVGVSLFVAAINLNSAWLGFPGWGIMIGAMVFILFQLRRLRAKRIDDNYVWLKGAGSAFLMSLPSWWELGQDLTDRDQ